MIYLKTDVRGQETRIPIYTDEIFTICPRCKREFNVDVELLAVIIKDSDLASTSLYCENCSSITNENVYPLSILKNKNGSC